MQTKEMNRQEEKIVKYKIFTNDMNWDSNSVYDGKISYEKYYRVQIGHSLTVPLKFVRFRRISRDPFLGSSCDLEIWATKEGKEVEIQRHDWCREVDASDMSIVFV